MMNDPKNRVSADAAGLAAAIERAAADLAIAEEPAGFVLALEGEGEITIDGKPFRLKALDSILMPANHPHSVSAIEPFKMFLVVAFPPETKEVNENESNH